MQTRLKIFSDRTFVAPGEATHCAMLSAFWGEGESVDWRLGSTPFADYQAHAAKYFDFVDRIEDADLVILPSTWHRYLVTGTEGLALQFAGQAQAAGKAIAVFHERDYDFRFPAQNAVLFSPALEKQDTSQVFALPAWVVDHFDGAAPPRPKSARPTVGFCGWVRPKTTGTVLKQRAFTWIPMLARKSYGGISASTRGTFRYRFLRNNVIEALQRAPEIDTNFLLRTEFFSGTVKVNDKAAKAQAIEDSRQAFMDNLIQSDYALCPRGVGNYSLRFYEALAAGRIPLFINTNCILPFNKTVDWTKEFFWIDHADLSALVPRLLDYHNSMSDQAFVERQVRLREMWEEWLSPDGFFRNFHRHFSGASSILSQVA